MLRKPACHFGWDWNLAIAPLGIYGRIALRPVRQARIEHVQTAQQHRDDGSVSVDVAVDAASAARAGTVPLTIRFAGRSDRLRSRLETGETRSHRTLHHRSTLSSGGRPAPARRRSIHA